MFLITESRQQLWKAIRKASYDITILQISTATSEGWTLQKSFFQKPMKREQTLGRFLPLNEKGILRLFQ
jgi:hypothetical protein